MLRSKAPHGFTIVELLVVIAIIGILAAITVVSYNGIQARARDAIRQQHVSQISDSLQLYHLREGNFIENGSGCGRFGDGYGWFNYGGGPVATMSPDGNYTKSIAACLSEAGYLTEQIMDPSGVVAYHATEQADKHTYMKHNCIENDRTVTYVFAKLERPESSTAVEDSDICEFSKNSALSYGMNYFIKIE